MGMFQDAMIQLDNIGVLDVILPFILVFTIVFATLQKTKILGEDENKKPRKNFNSIVALVMGLAVVIPHVINPQDNDVVNIINGALPNVSAVLVAVIMLLLIIGVFGSKVDIAGSSLSGWAVIFALVATIVIFANAANWVILPGWLSFLEDTQTQSLIIVILVFALIIWFVTKEDKAKDPKKYSSIEDLGKILGYKKE